MTKQQLTYNEVKAVFDYKSFYGYIINEKLRSGEALSEYDKEKVLYLDNVLFKTECYRHSIIRCVKFKEQNEFDTFMEQHKTGSFVVYNAYTSFSTDFNKVFDEEANIRLVVLKPKTARDIRLIGENGEDEVLYERNSSFRIVSNELWKGIHWITMEEI